MPDTTTYFDPDSPTGWPLAWTPGLFAEPDPRTRRELRSELGPDEIGRTCERELLNRLVEKP